MKILKKLETIIGIILYIPASLFILFIGLVALLIGGLFYIFMDLYNLIMEE